MKIYNTITTQSCDANFRKMGNLTIVSVEVLGSNSNSEADPKRFLQSNQSFVSETFPAVNMSLTYHVQGRCRNCPVAPGGSFQLYDDVFRRRLGIQSSLVKILNVRELQEDESIAFADDCFCREGLEPVQPQAPGVQECIDAMNIKFDNLAVTDGLFQNISMLNLFQLDDLDHEEDSVTSSSVSATVWGNPLFAVPCLTTCSGIAGGILGLLSFF